MAKHVTANTIEINSVWRARDGRRVKVIGVTLTEHVKGGWWADLEVLPPYYPRQRRKTTANAESFTSGFYVRDTRVIG